MNRVCPLKDPFVIGSAIFGFTELLGSKKWITFRLFPGADYKVSFAYMTMKFTQIPKMDTFTQF